MTDHETKGGKGDRKPRVHQSWGKSQEGSRGEKGGGSQKRKKNPARTDRNFVADGNMRKKSKKKKEKELGVERPELRGESSVRRLGEGGKNRIREREVQT